MADKPVLNIIPTHEVNRVDDADKLMLIIEENDAVALAIMPDKQPKSLFYTHNVVNNQNHIHIRSPTECLKPSAVSPFSFVYCTYEKCLCNVAVAVKH